MAYTPIFGTGLEMGAIPLPAGWQVGNLAISSTIVKTGVYSVLLRGATGTDGELHFHNADGLNYLDFAAWVYPHGASDYKTTIQLVLNNATTVSILNAGTSWDAYVNGVLVESGTVIVTNQQWQHVQARFYVADSGYIQTRINGMDDIDYADDTLPSGATDIDYLRLYQGGDGTPVQDTYFDDITFGTGGWPGDIRFDKIYPDGDVTTEWTPSTPGTHYTLVDERPPSDTDYVTGGSVPVVTDQYTMSAWSGTAKTVQFVIPWARVKKDSAGTIKLDIGLDSNGTEDMSGGQDVNTAYEYRYHIVELNPDGDAVWDEDAINAVEVIIRTAE